MSTQSRVINIILLLLLVVVVVVVFWLLSRKWANKKIGVSGGKGVQVN